jgi:hypothetical protein
MWSPGKKQRSPSDARLILDGAALESIISLFTAVIVIAWAINVLPN